MSEPLTLDQISQAAQRAALNCVIRHIEDRIKALRCDSSAISPENVGVYAAGFRSAKHAVLECLSDD